MNSFILIFVFSTATLLLLLSPVHADIATGFMSTINTQGDKCSACVAARKYYCTNPVTKVRDCYDSIEDCSPYPTTASNAPWVSSQLDCQVALANATACS